MSQFIFLCLIYFTGTNTSSLFIIRIKSWNIIKAFPSIFKNTSQGRLDILVTHYIAGCFGNLHFSNLSKNWLSTDLQNIVYCYWLHIKRDENKTEEVVRNLFKKKACNFWLNLPSKHDRVSFREEETDSAWIFFTRLKIKVKNQCWILYLSDHRSLRVISQWLN